MQRRNVRTPVELIAAPFEEHSLVYGVKDLDLVAGRVILEDELWQNYTYFMRAVLPVAEAEGVKLALHPDDPPIPMLGGIGRLFYHFDGFRRAMEVAASPNHGLDFCMGCWSEIGPNVLDAIRYFGSRSQIFYVHFRDVQGVGISPAYHHLGRQSAGSSSG